MCYHPISSGNRSALATNLWLLHTCTRTHTQSHPHTHKCTDTGIYMHKITQTRTHTCTNTNRYMHIYTNALTQTHKHIHAQTHWTCAKTQTHTCTIGDPHMHKAERRVCVVSFKCSPFNNHYENSAPRLEPPLPVSPYPSDVLLWQWGSSTASAGLPQVINAHTNTAEHLLWRASVDTDLSKKNK